MIKDITFGQYFPGNSVIHRMDPRMKIILSIAVLVLIFVANSYASLLFMVLLIFGIVLISKIPVKIVLKSVKPILPVIVLTSILNIFNVQGDVILKIWFFNVTVQGIQAAIFIAVRLVCLIAASSMLTYTTSPTMLTDAIERLLSPLNYLHIEVHSIAMMMTIALRFIPTLIEEVDKIISAQKARGADMESGNLIQKVKSMIPILVPLFVSSFRRAYELAYAMECRCYRGGTGRTRMKEMHIGKIDYFSAILVAVCIVLVILLNFIVW